MNAIKRFYSSIIKGASPARTRTDDLIPPRDLIDGVGGGDFQRIGRDFFGYFTQIGSLKPHHRILDVGCGCGRMAIPMMPFLSEQGSYYGFDIVPEAIQWSKKHITTRDARFHFEWASVFNKHYNPKGKIAPDQYRFPYDDHFFDFALLTSVFTHMLADEMEHYLSEISRTLKPGGQCMITYFILNAEVTNDLSQAEKMFDFKHPRSRCTIWKPEVPEAAVAYEESYIRECFARNKLSVIEPIHFGRWPGRKKFLSGQDLILAVKN
jgi:SAM-dependent methyltransferase